MHGNKNYLSYQTPVHSGGDWKGILLSMWVFLTGNTTNTSSCSPSSCVPWIMAAVDQVSTANQVRAVSVQFQVGKDLPANTLHPPEHEGAKHQQSQRACVVQTGTNSYILGKAFMAFAVLQKHMHISCFVIFALIIEIIWYQCFSSLIVF